MADYRRKIQALAGLRVTTQSSQYSLVKKTETTNTVTPKYSVPSVNPVVHESKTDYTYVLSDLGRIAVLTVLAICAQLVLWYRLGRG